MNAGVAEFIEWDVVNWSAALDVWSRESALDLRRCTALELGSRHGGLSLWLALQGARVVCSDLEPPSRLARARHRAAGVAARIEYCSLDGFHLPFRNRFDVVVFKSVLGAVGRAAGRAGQARVIAEIHQALKPGGELFFAENLVASPLHRVCRRRFTPWGAHWRYVSPGDMRAFLAPFRHVAYRTVGFAGAFGLTEGQRRVLGRLDRAGLERLVPAGWRYIIVGIARK